MNRAVVTVAEALADCGPVERAPAEAALAALLGVDQGFLYAHPERPLPAAVTERFAELLRARGMGGALGLPEWQLWILDPGAGGQ